jgi:hypothetical protein
MIKFQLKLLEQEAEQYCLRSIDSRILFGIRKNCLISGRSLLLYQFPKNEDTTDCSNCRGILLPSTSYKIVSNVLLARLSPYMKGQLKISQKSLTWTVWFTMSLYRLDRILLVTSTRKFCTFYFLL